jgi:hypothetical protein
LRASSVVANLLGGFQIAAVIYGTEVTLTFSKYYGYVLAKAQRNWLAGPSTWAEHIKLTPQEAK